MIRSSRPNRSTAASVALVVAGAAVLIGSLASLGLSGGAAAAPRAVGVVPAVEIRPGDVPPGAEQGDTLLRGVAVPVRPAPPQRVRAEVVGLDAALTPIGTDRAGGLRVPEQGDLVGWWAAGPRPGERTGTVVLTGHVDTRDEGAGALARATRLRPGDRVEIAGASSRTDYRVEAVRSYPKTGLPPEVFAAYGRPRLVLVTCGGDFDERTRHYADNVVVYAVPAPAETDSPRG